MKAEKALASQLVLAEYSALQEALHKGFGYAWTIVGWTLAAFGASLGAGLLAASQPSTPYLDWAVMGLFGVFVPALVWAGATSWLGELIRTERAAAYLRGIEKRARIAKIFDGRDLAPIGYYLRTQGLGNRDLAGRQLWSGLGVAATFFLASALGLGFFFMRWAAYPNAWVDLGYLTILIVATILEAVGIAACFLIATRLRRLHRLVQPL